MSDALERLKNRNRPTVPSRDASLAPAPEAQDISVSSSLDIQVPTHTDISEPKPQELLPPLETKQATMRLEVGISDRLQNLCRENGICREVLIEAMFEYCEANPEALEIVLGAAGKKNEHRQQIANQKRAQTMMARFGQ